MTPGPSIAGTAGALPARAERHGPLRRLVLTLALLALAPAASAQATVRVPLVLDVALVRAALFEQVFAASDEPLEVLTDARGCNRLALRLPLVDTTAEGKLRLRLPVEARGGAALGTGCALSFGWSGLLELLEEPIVDADGTHLGFRITDSALLVPDGSRTSTPGVLWGWVKRLVHPRLTAFRLDLAPVLDGTRALLAQALAAARTAEQPVIDVRLQATGVDPRGLWVDVAIALPPEASAAWEAPAVPLTQAELAAWDARWQAWDAFATWLVKEAAGPAPEALRAGLLETLLDARYALREALARDVPEADPVRRLFVDAWQRLAPQLATLYEGLPAADALRHAAFVHAGDALLAVDGALAAGGVTLDSLTLRRLARTLSPAVTDEALAYGRAVDPVLRELFGLPAALSGTGPRVPAPSAVHWPFRAAHAADDDPAPGSWVPVPESIDAYLDAVRGLLEVTAGDDAVRKRVSAAYADVYQALLPATAWQESCWRQFERRGEEVTPLRSSAGSVGLMQVNVHVWRGLYDAQQLEHDIVYNVRAGNEILVHYLVDYAIRRGEHEVRGDVHDLARATYAIYNGGPAHLNRYRREDTKQTLRAIDRAFWKKYEAVRSRGPAAVKACFG